MKLLLLLFPLAANAGDWSAQYHMHSNTMSTRQYENWNEGTDGSALRYSVNDNLAIQAGHYRNEFTVRQYNFFTNYIGADYTPWKVGPVSFGGYGWATSGYNKYDLAEMNSSSHPSKVISETDTGILFTGGVLARLEYKRISVTVRLRPTIGGIPAAVSTEVGFRFTGE